MHQSRWLLTLCLSVVALPTNFLAAQYYQGQYYQPQNRYAPNQPYGSNYGQPNRQSARQPNKDTPTPAAIIKYAAQPNPKFTPFPRLPGEFEKQKAMMLSVADLQTQHHAVLKSIIEKLAGRLPVLVLVNDTKQLKDTVEMFDSIGCELDHVSFHVLKLDSIWLRDFGPRLCETENGAATFDFYYDGTRPRDDKFPGKWGQAANAPMSLVKWTLQGGNLISNGKGLAVTTSRLFEDNFIEFGRNTTTANREFERRKIVVDAFKSELNINQIAVLEPLRPEATKHVDMFATFIAPDHIVVASVDPRVDPANARTLDNNAALLKQFKVDGKPLKVDRIRIPGRKGKYWSPYTNVLFANNVLLMPTYQSDPPATIKNAISTFKNLLPDAYIETIDMTSMQKLEGALHCLSMNVPEFAELPKDIMSFAEAKEKVNAKDFVAFDSSEEDRKNAIVMIRQPDGSLVKAPPHMQPTSPFYKPPTETSSTGSQSQPQNKRSSQANASRSNTNETDAQTKAVESYRRRFAYSNGQFMIEGYAIGFESGSVRVLRADSGLEVLVRFDNMSNEDRYWLSQNQDKIRRNGPNVKQFVVNSRAR